ncbi:hypothetical protein ACRAWD_09475 [Caulobacter segnis]
MTNLRPLALTALLLAGRRWTPAARAETPETAPAKPVYPPIARTAYRTAQFQLDLADRHPDPGAAVADRRAGLRLHAGRARGRRAGDGVCPCRRHPLADPDARRAVARLQLGPPAPADPPPAGRRRAVLAAADITASLGPDSPLKSRTPLGRRARASRCASC